MRPQPRITVIIPTRERCDVLEKSLRTVTAQQYDNLEIIVSDNFSQDRTREVVEASGDSRVRYVNTGRRLSMSDNWEFALSHVTDGWVAMLGDDDGLLQGAVAKVAGLIDDADVLAIRAERCAYIWPSLRGLSFGQLRVPLRRGTEIRTSRDWLERLMLGRASYLDLPVLYEGGFVHTSVLATMRRKTGRVYRSSQPDIYSAIAIASVVDRYLYSYDPFAIAGMSAHSTGASHWAGRKDDSPVKKFTLEGNIPFHPDVPLNTDGTYPRSYHALVYESYLQSQPLRDERRADRHEEQLELFLALAKHEADVRTWAQLFADAHALDLDRATERAKWRRMRFKLDTILQRARNAVDTVVVNSSEFPVRDIYEASIAATAIRDSRPSALRRAQEVTQLVRRAVHRLEKSA